MSIHAALDRATAAYPLLEHPFYKAWAEGALSKEDLVLYASEYWNQVEAFPHYLSDVADRVRPGRIRQVLLENLSDEVDGNHPGMWLDFAKAVGLEQDSVPSSIPQPETVVCVNAFKRAMKQASLEFALGML